MVLGTYTCGSGSCQYADFGPDSEQQRWLRADLAAFSRDKTPWLIAAMHAPWCACMLMPSQLGRCTRAGDPTLRDLALDSCCRQSLMDTMLQNDTENF